MPKRNAAMYAVDFVAMANPALRWGRIALGGFLAELILIVVVVLMRAAGSGETSITAAAVIGSFLVFVPVTRWLTRGLSRPVLHGALMGAAAAAIYVALGAVAALFIPDAPPTPFVYYVAHALKVAGGATGGWLGSRFVAEAASTPARTA
jgi:hypothetical protein